MSIELYDFRQRLEQQGIFFCFSGPISQELLIEIGEILKCKMKLKDAKNNMIIKVFSMVVEMAQNIIHYSAERSPVFIHKHDGKQISHGIIAVGYEFDHYFVWSGNFVYKRQMEHLRRKLSVLTEMNKEDIKQYYRNQRRVGPDLESKGAGLGLIEMAKKAYSPLEYAFEEVDEAYSFFSIKIVL